MIATTEKFIDRRNKSVATYLNSIEKISLVTPKQEVELITRYQAGDEEARNTLVKANLRLVVTIVKDYQGLGLPMEDLISEGNLGLVKAANHFKADAGAKFSTYAAFWIKDAVSNAINSQSGSVKVPAEANLVYTRMEKVRERLEKELYREPTIEEIADELGIETSRLLEYIKAMRFSVRLDVPVDDEEDFCPLNYLSSNDKSAATDFHLEQESFHEELEKVFDLYLDEREAFVIRHSYWEQETLANISDYLQISPERVRQIKASAEKKLKRYLSVRYLRMCC